MRVELSVIARLQGLIGLHQLTWLARPLGDLVLDGVLEIGQKPHSVLQLDGEGLIIDWRPGSTDKVRVAVLLVLALLSLHLVLVHDLDFPDVLLGEIKVVVLLDYLEPIN